MNTAIFQPTTFPTSAAEVTQPVTGAILHKEYVKTISRLATAIHFAARDGGTT